jgi:uncharacterized protein YecT (DUF1311 family)
MRKPKSIYPQLALCLLIGLLTLPVHAADDSCKDAATTAAMRACENTRYQKADQELNAIYAKLTKQLEPARQEKLRQSQRAWLAFRDANADFLAGAAEGGTLAPLIKVTVMAEMTEARTQELQKQAQH